MPAEVMSEHSPAQSEVLNKYQAAAELANKALAYALALVSPGASALSICVRTDEELTQLATKVYRGVSKGISFPCCVSVNNTLCHFSPMDVESDVQLKEGDLVKVELGAHIDGFPALVASSVVVGATKDKPATGLAADLVHAAHLTAEAALRLIRDGKSSAETAATLKKLTGELNVSFVEGMISHSVSKDRLAHDKMIIVNPSDQQAKMVQPCVFSNYDVFVVDVAISSAEGKVEPNDNLRTNIYCRTGDTYSLRLKTSRAVVSEASSRFGTMAFHIRQLEDSTKARMGLLECTQHGVTNAYEVLEDKKDALTARVMFTTVLLPAGPLKITDYKYDIQTVKPAVAVKSKELLELLDAPVRVTKKDKRTAA
ncbi:DNA-binding protein, 42 kDa [Paramicrosporidium saccamoebae]|uniref:DNA-binding protein, 42 kDa n=1 Tax=Paramicrosporidium saccamoebae TaxID=1246581 RepID=A0A2H9TMW8_9FUNG|nr:DNA-binding protein, 42 kDa [Paramicrosporidium saccamoebae]